MDAELIRKTLEDAGLRCTPQRYAVMAVLTDQTAHPTAFEIFEAVNRLDPRSSRATTYNNLRDLVQAGLVREVALEGRAARFDLKGRRHNTSSVIAAERWRTWRGTTCRSPIRMLWDVASCATTELLLRGLCVTCAPKPHSRVTLY